jgi:hypothetical protein
MIVHDTEARLLFARERASLLANEMRTARRAKEAEPRRSAPEMSTGLFSRLREQRRLSSGMRPA